jgi:hypothetical protein
MNEPTLAVGIEPGKTDQGRNHTKQADGQQRDETNCVPE